MSAVTSNRSSAERDELMDVGLEFVTDSNTSTKPLHPPTLDSASAGRTPTHQVFKLPGFAT